LTSVIALETMTASLTEFGDHTLVLTVLGGLNWKFRHMMLNLKMQR
jgi:hypothetical protein